MSKYNALWEYVQKDGSPSLKLSFAGGGITLDIKTATINDVKDISYIHAVSWKTAYKGVIPQDYLDNLKNDFWVLEENLRAQKFYTKNGFSKTEDKLSCEISGKKFIDIRFILQTQTSQ